MEMERRIKPDHSNEYRLCMVSTYNSNELRNLTCSPICGISQLSHRMHFNMKCFYIEWLNLWIVIGTTTHITHVTCAQYKAWCLFPSTFQCQYALPSELYVYIQIYSQTESYNNSIYFLTDNHGLTERSKRRWNANHIIE